MNEREHPKEEICGTVKKKKALRDISSALVGGAPPFLILE
jgi:hypothetical protein